MTPYSADSRTWVSRIVHFRYILYPANIHIYTYCHPETNWFVGSQLFSVARLARYFKFDISLQNYRPSQRNRWLFLNVNSYLPIRLSASGVLYAREERCIYRHVAAGNNQLECSTHGAEVHIYYHPQTDCFVITQLFSATRHAIENRLILHQSDILPQFYCPSQCKRNYFIYIHSSAAGVPSSWEEVCVYIYMYIFCKIYNFSVPGEIVSDVMFQASLRILNISSYFLTQATHSGLIGLQFSH